MKRRAVAQRAGERGEAAFDSWATDRGLLPTKPRHDYGLDFILQVDPDPESEGVSQMAGTLIGAAVRSSSAAKPRFKLDRDDARSLLDIRIGCIVAVVAIKPDDTKLIRYRLLDVDFADELTSFLESEQKTHTISWETCSDEESLQADILSLLDPSYVQRRRIALAQRRIGRSLDGVAIEVRQRADLQLTYMTVPEFFGIFEQGADADRQAVYAATFGAPRLQDDRLRRLSLSRALTDHLDELPAPIRLAGFSSTARVQIVVEGPKRARCISPRLQRTLRGICP